MTRCFSCARETAKIVPAHISQMQSEHVRVNSVTGDAADLQDVVALEQNAAGVILLGGFLCRGMANGCLAVSGDLVDSTDA